MKNIDTKEVKKFDTLAYRWWDKEGSLKTLHHINPARLDFIETQISLDAQQVIDVGCGGGILTEALAKKGAHVHGIDASEKLIFIAKQHAQQSQLDITYQQCTAESLAKERTQQFDIVTCMELLEHVPDPQILVDACAQLVKPGGHVFFSTVNRTPKAFTLAIIGAEYIMNLLPKGTHEYSKFIQPAELDSCARHAQLKLKSLKGIHYNPFTKTCRLTNDLSVNYLACYTHN